MPGLVPGIHVFCAFNTWMAGTSPAMTKKCVTESENAQTPSFEERLCALRHHQRIDDGDAFASRMHQHRIDLDLGDVAGRAGCEP